MVRKQRIMQKAILNRASLKRNTKTYLAINN